MKKFFPLEVEQFRVDISGNMPIPTTYTENNSGFNGSFFIRTKKLKEGLGDFFIILTDFNGWDHVSISKIRKNKKSIPSWKAMCFFKDLFFEPEEVVVQYHPKKSQYVNLDPSVLHLWRKQDDSIIVPPSNMV